MCARIHTHMQTHTNTHKHTRTHHKTKSDVREFERTENNKTVINKQSTPNILCNKTQETHEKENISVRVVPCKSTVGVLIFWVSPDRHDPKRVGFERCGLSLSLCIYTTHRCLTPDEATNNIDRPKNVNNTMK